MKKKYTHFQLFLDPVEISIDKETSSMIIEKFKEEFSKTGVKIINVSTRYCKMEFDYEKSSENAELIKRAVVSIRRILNRKIGIIYLSELGNYNEH